jgi:hypothetical protein
MFCDLRFAIGLRAAEIREAVVITVKSHASRLQIAKSKTQTDE